MAKVGGFSGPNTAFGMPAGGSAGQILVKNSGADADWSWQNIPSGVDPLFMNTYTSGYWYSNLARYSTSTGSAFTVSANTVLYLFPMCLSSTVSFKSVAFYVSSTNTGTGSIGVYSMTDNGYPGTLLASASGIGVGAPVGFKSATLDKTLTLSNWFYYGIAATSQAFNVTGVANTLGFLLPFGRTATPAAGDMSFMQNLTCTITGGVLPANPSSFTSVNSNVPLVWMQVL